MESKVKTNDLEAMIRSMNKIARENIISLQKREKRKLNIKEKKLQKRTAVVDEDF